MRGKLRNEHRRSEKKIFPSKEKQNYSPRDDDEMDDDDPPAGERTGLFVAGLFPEGASSLARHHTATTPTTPTSPTKVPGPRPVGAAMRGSHGTRLAWLALLAQRGMHSKHARACTAVVKPLSAADM